MASVVINANDIIRFVNISAGKGQKDDPSLLVQSGDWDVEDHVEAGIVFEVTGNCAPILTATNARKLAQWLIRAADDLDGVKVSKKKQQKRQYDEDDEDDFQR